MYGRPKEVPKNERREKLEKDIKKLRAENIALKEEKEAIAQSLCDANDEIRNLKVMLVKQAHTPQAHTPDSLAETLQLDLDTSESTSDILSSHGIGIAGSLAFQSRSQWAANHEYFKAWMLSDDSQALCIQGHGDMEKISPLSYLISLLHQRQSKLKKNLVLTFFCGIHAVSPFDKETSGPLVLAKSILTQLLALPDIDWDHGQGGSSVLSDLQQKDISKSQQDSFRAYLRVIGALLKALGGLHQAIFVLIDGYEYYDRRWESKMTHLIDIMTETVESFNKSREGGQVCTLKVLFTAATYSRSLAPENVSMVTINMPKDIETDRDGFQSLC
ncbi:uncharacterized protein N0V89_000096 [Didymosphaeria variabile]|uniref:Nephrocystin 3-like N-terminal domain-containing protein n=1 Tax=Didymosphaeria variabile TaxID=1932322 RepID=A0A9W9CFI5_9PLEO|nr:uncharacterized protein N0V89_000096 [Didymosphaeria variabile]KAJ4359541.1 hypothetical protein N0V89_000096 [Didymosphaeria variabile]